MTTLHQWIPVLDPGDAASNHTLQVQRLLHDHGITSEIFTERTHPDLAGRTHPYESYPGGPVLYQFAIGARMADTLLGASMPLAVNSHNVTPPEFFEVWDPPLVHGCSWGRAQLAALARRADLAIGVSSFNAADLDAAGYRRTAVAPILLDTAVFDREADLDLLADLTATKTGRDWLFVGRIVPNKCQHDLVKAFAVHARRHPDDRLFLVGGASSSRYEKALVGLIGGLGLADRVRLTGSVGPGGLAAHYRNADVFVCVSAHEGFCVPLLEAMHHRVPIVAHDAAAIAGTLGGAGIVLPSKEPEVVATAVERVLTDEPLRERIAIRATARLTALSLEASRATMWAALEAWIAGLVG